MDNYSSFYEKIIKTKKREIDFEKIKNNLSIDQKINKHEIEKSKLKNELIYIKENKENIENNKFFLIPFSQKNWKKFLTIKKQMFVKNVNLIVIKIVNILQFHLVHVMI